MRPDLLEDGPVDRKTDSSALLRAQYGTSCSTEPKPTLELLGTDGGASGYALVGSPPSRSVGALPRVGG